MHRDDLERLLEPAEVQDVKVEMRKLTKYRS